MRSSGFVFSLSNTISMMGRISRASPLPITLTYSSRPSMNSSAMAGWVKLSWMNCTRSFRDSRSGTTDACAMPLEASSSSGFTMSGNGTSGASFTSSVTR